MNGIRIKTKSCVEPNNINLHFIITIMSYTAIIIMTNWLQTAKLLLSSIENKSIIIALAKCSYLIFLSCNLVTVTIIPML